MRPISWGGKLPGLHDVLGFLVDLALDVEIGLEDRGDVGFHVLRRFGFDLFVGDEILDDGGGDGGDSSLIQAHGVPRFGAGALFRW